MSLKPLQMQGGMVAALFLPVLGFFALWRWDERKRFLEAHPEIVRRRQALRDLRREKKSLQQAVAAGDAEKFLRHAVAAMRVAVAPHFPAEARAMVGGDVLSQLAESDRSGRDGETVRKICAAEDARFGAGQKQRADMLAAHADVELVLKKLEAKL